MSNIDARIKVIDDAICNNIDAFASNQRGLLSQNILAQLRNFIEHISLKIYFNGADGEYTYRNITKANNFISANGRYRFLSRFHRLLQIVASHYTLEPENSERLMLKYYQYLLEIKKFLNDNYGLCVLSNIHKFPVNTDTGFQEYYEKIAKQIDTDAYYSPISSSTDRYYIQKCRPFFVDENIYYEITFTAARDNVSKFEHLIAFTKFDILTNYAVKLVIRNCSINIFGKHMPIQIIEDWAVSVRPCEIDNFAKIFGINSKLGATKETAELMRLLTSARISLVELIDLPDNTFMQMQASATQNIRKAHIWEILNKCRTLSQSRSEGCNVIRYLLYQLNNRIIKSQYISVPCGILSNLYIRCGCKPFDDMPFNTSLVNHNPKIFDIFDCIDPAGRENELLARFIRNNTEYGGQLYVSESDIIFKNIDTLITEYNNALYHKHKPIRKIEKYKNHLYINGYESEIYEIIKKLKTLSSQYIENYTNSVDVWLRTNAYKIDCPEKKEALRRMFASSKVAFIYGPAGTGKTTLISHISNFYNNRTKIYLANTNPAVDNLKRKINAANSSFKTIASFLLDSNKDKRCDILFIDECSTVSNNDLLNILTSADFKMLVLVGDVYQIESILFGNWFSITKSIVPSTAVFELERPYRTNDDILLELWRKIRNIDDDILEHITRNNFSTRLNESIFQQTDEDEIVLCLNYDGLYGINNINKFLQSNNSNDSIEWGLQTYKVGDPILFNESKRFYPVIYNNLKGRITKIEKSEDVIHFETEVMDVSIDGLDAEDFGFELIGSNEKGNCIIGFDVNRLKSTDDDNESLDTVVPFQVAYAVSIHKAQGLEYTSVKVVITNEIEELITHNIFYTAITRAKKSLKIYWTPETEKKILGSLKHKDTKKDIALLKSKYDDI